MIRLGLRKRVSFCVALVPMLIGCGGEPGRVRASKAELVGVYETQFGDGEERLELRLDQSYVQDLTWRGQPIHHAGRWALENMLWGGSDVVLISSVVSGPGPDGKVGQAQLGDWNLNVHKRSGKFALALNETADWYFEPVK